MNNVVVDPSGAGKRLQAGPDAATPHKRPDGAAV
jgi:hypothetical protein